MKEYYVYILSNKSKTLYTGVTNNLFRRMYEHKHKLNKGFTSKYRIDKLVFFEKTNDVNSAIVREKQIKGWKREKKLELIKQENPDLIDLSSGWFNE